MLIAVSEQQAMHVAISVRKTKVTLNSRSDGSYFRPLKKCSYGHIIFKHVKKRHTYRSKTLQRSASNSN